MTTELQKAVDTYPTASNEVREFIRGLFPKHNFENKIATFEDAYPLFLKKKFTDKLFINLQKRKKTDLTAFDKLLIIANILQGDWKADYSNTSQYKYYPWFVYDKANAGFGFSGAGCDDGRSGTYVGSRLCLPNEELAKYFGSHPAFLKLHNEHHLINQ